MKGKLQPIPALRQRIVRFFLVRTGGSAATRGSLHAAAVDAQFHAVGGIAHLLLGGEDDFRGFEGVCHGDFKHFRARCVRLEGGEKEYRHCPSLYYFPMSCFHIVSSF